MGSYKVVVKKSVYKDLRKIDKKEIPKIINAIEQLSENPYPQSSKKLVGSTKTFRLRIGDYRAIYVVNEDLNEIEVQKVRHRKEVYR